MEYEQQYDQLLCKHYGIEPKYNIELIYKKIKQNDKLTETSSTKEYIKEIVDNMLCLYFNYDYENISLVEEATNPFIARLCEKDYVQYIVDFWNRTSSKQMPNWIYSSNIFVNSTYRKMSISQYDLDHAISNLVEWGKSLDNFLQDRNDFLKFDYLVRAVCSEEENDHYQFLKWYSLCQLLLEKNKENELDWKLPTFLDARYSEEERKKMSELFRRMRNKIAHGCFVEFEKIIE